jgi:hypothetical protein
MKMNTADAFMQGMIACEVDGCAQVSTAIVKDFGHLFGQGQIASELIQIGPTHFFCSLHKRDSYSFKKVNGQWVRF